MKDSGRVPWARVRSDRSHVVAFRERALRREASPTFLERRRDEEEGVAWRQRIVKKKPLAPFREAKGLVRFVDAFIESKNDRYAYAAGAARTGRVFGWTLV